MDDPATAPASAPAEPVIVDAATEFAAETAAPAVVETAPAVDAEAAAAEKRAKADKIREEAFAKISKADPETPEDDQPAANEPDEQEPARGEDGKFIAKAGTPEQREAVVLARRAMQRDGWDDADIAALKPDRLVALGQKAAKRQADADAMGAKVARALRAKQTESTDEYEPSAQPASRSPLDDLLAELDGTEEARPEPEPSTHAAGDELAKARAELALTRIENAERDLLNDFPGLKDDVNRAKIAAAAFRLNGNQSVMGLNQKAIAELMAEACYVVFGKELKAKNEQSRRDRVQRARTVIDGQPDIESRPAVSPRTLSKDQIRKAAFEASNERDPGKAEEKFKKLKGQAGQRR